jgi:hypothetical protein
VRLYKKRVMQQSLAAVVVYLGRERRQKRRGRRHRGLERLTVECVMMCLIDIFESKQILGEEW